MANSSISPAQTKLLLLWPNLRCSAIVALLLCYSATLLFCCSATLLLCSVAADHATTPPPPPTRAPLPLLVTPLPPLPLPLGYFLFFSSSPRSLSFSSPSPFLLHSFPTSSSSPLLRSFSLLLRIPPSLSFHSTLFSQPFCSPSPRHLPQSSLVRAALLRHLLALTPR